MPLPDKDLLRRLVGFDSVSCSSNAPIAGLVCEHPEGPGVEIVRDARQVNLVATGPGTLVRRGTRWSLPAPSTATGLRRAPWLYHELNGDEAYSIE